MKKYLSLILVASFLIALLTPWTTISAEPDYNYGGFAKGHNVL